jgi:ATP-dependent RNA helicase RhlE
LLAKHGGFRCHVLEPTRELAAQVKQRFVIMELYGLRVALVHGGVGYGKQREELKRGVIFLSPRPGVYSMLEQRAMSLKK